MSLLYKRKLHIYSLNFVPLFLKYSVCLCMYLSVYLWLCWVFTAVHGRSLVAVSGAPLLGGAQPSWLLFLRSTGSSHKGFCSCSSQAQESWDTGLSFWGMRNLPSSGIACLLWQADLPSTLPPGKSWTSFKCSGMKKPTNICITYIIFIAPLISLQTVLKMLLLVIEKRITAYYIPLCTLQCAEVNEGMRCHLNPVTRFFRIILGYCE